MSVYILAVCKQAVCALFWYDPEDDANEKTVTGNINTTILLCIYGKKNYFKMEFSWYLSEKDEMQNMATLTVCHRSTPVPFAG